MCDLGYEPSIEPNKEKYITDFYGHKLEPNEQYFKSESGDIFCHECIHDFKTDQSDREWAEANGFKTMRERVNMYDKLIKELQEMLPPKIDYAEMVGAEATHYGHCFVWEDPEPYIIMAAIGAITELWKGGKKMKTELKDLCENVIEKSLNKISELIDKEPSTDNVNTIGILDTLSRDLIDRIG